MNNPIKKSRRKTRQCLFQALYSCVYLQGKFDKELFIETFYDEEFAGSIDEVYFNEIFE
jgi:transcription termination factor NusB